MIPATINVLFFFYFHLKGLDSFYFCLDAKSSKNPEASGQGQFDAKFSVLVKLRGRIGRGRDSANVKDKDGDSASYYEKQQRALCGACLMNV
jgi:hypothetical protein